jgi:hypothetical protein
MSGLRGILQLLNIMVNESRGGMVAIVNTIVKQITLLPSPSLYLLMIYVLHITPLLKILVVWQSAQRHTQPFKAIVQEIGMLQVHDRVASVYRLKQTLDSFYPILQ